MAENSRQVTLPSGRVATIRDGKGRDLMHAQRVVQGINDPGAVTFALIAALVEIDGQPIVYEDIMEMNLKDVFMLTGEVVGGIALPSPPTSRDSSNLDSPRAN